MIPKGPPQDAFQMFFYSVAGLECVAAGVASLCCLWYLTRRLARAPLSRRLPFALMGCGMASLCVSIAGGYVPPSQGPWAFVITANLLWFWQQRKTMPVATTAGNPSPKEIKQSGDSQQVLQGGRVR